MGQMKDPIDYDLKYNLALEFKQLGNAALENLNENPILFELADLDKALYKYKKRDQRIRHLETFRD